MVFTEGFAKSSAVANGTADNARTSVNATKLAIIVRLCFIVLLLVLELVV